MATDKPSLYSIDSSLIFGSSITTGNFELYTDNPGVASGTKINSGVSLASKLNTWNHLALTRQSGAIKMWLNGNQVGSTYSANTLNFGPTMGLSIMKDHIAGADGSGNLSNIRVITGTSIYNSTFTVPTSPLTAIPGTQLLLNTYYGVNFLKDNSVNNFTVTNVGGTTSSNLNPF